MTCLCDRFVRCRWAVRHACKSGGRSSAPRESARSKAKKLGRKIMVALFRLRIKMFVGCHGILCRLLLRKWRSLVNTEALFLEDMAIVRLEVPSQVLEEA